MTSETPAPTKRLRLAGLWFMPDLFEENVMVVCMDTSPMGCAYAPKDNDTEESFKNRRKRAAPAVRALVGHPNVVLTTSCWGQDAQHPVHPLLASFIAGLRTQGFGEPETVWPSEELHLCRLLPWCTNLASADLCHFCSECFHSALPQEQHDMARLYAPQQRFTGDCKNWMKAVGRAWPHMLRNIDERLAKAGKP